MSKKTVLFISPSEYCHNPRILKASDAFYAAGYEVIIWEVIQGSAEPGLNEKVKNTRPYFFIEFNISKNNSKSYISWLIVSLIQRLALELWNRLKLETKLFKYTQLKGLLGFKCPKKFDYVYTNVIDALPFVLYIAGTDKKILFDSQEYFKGQFEHADLGVRTWVEYAEKKCIPHVHVLIGTTNVLIEQLKEDYQISKPTIRVRNLPFDKQKDFPLSTRKTTTKLEIIWHGYAIYFNSRGINIILEAITLCEFDVHLTLMGKLNQDERNKITQFLTAKGHQDKVSFLPPAHPEKIVDALIGYDIGVIGELPLNSNQRLTSSNKLFEYIHAGLVVVTSNMPGILETIEDGVSGLVYEAGNAPSLALKLEQLHNDRVLLEKLKSNTRAFARDNYWKRDFEHVIEVL